MTSPASTIIDAVTPIQFSPPSQVNPTPGPPFNVAMSFLPGTSPGAVNFNDGIIIFFNGSGNDGIWYTTSAKGTTWTSVTRAAGLPIAAGSSPAAMEVPWNKRLFLFANTNTNSAPLPPGINFVTTTDLKNWTAPAALPGVGILGTTNPSTVSFSGNIYIFYNGSGSNGIWSSTITENLGQINLPTQITVGSSILDIMEGTSPCAVAFGSKLFLFYISAGSSGLATSTVTASSSTSEYRVFVTSSSNGSSWATPQQVGTTSTAGVSPTAVSAGLTPSATGLYLFWPTDPTFTVTYTFDGTDWEAPATFVLSQINGTSASAMNLGSASNPNAPYLFWTGHNGAIGGSGLGAVFSTFTPLNP